MGGRRRKVALISLEVSIFPLLFVSWLLLTKCSRLSCSAKAFSIFWYIPYSNLCKCNSLSCLIRLKLKLKIIVFAVQERGEFLARKLTPRVSAAYFPFLLWSQVNTAVF